MIENKRAQIENPLIVFAVLVVGLLMFAPVALKLFISIDSTVGNSLGNLTGNVGNISKANFQAVTTPLITFWDKVIVAVFFLSILLLFVSAFLIDAHPFFVILYVLSFLFLILFTPNILSAVDNIYDSANFATEIARLTFLDSLRNNFIVFLVGIGVVTGIIIYGKVALFSGGRSSNRR